MTKRMLIDATHAEETRVAVVDHDRLEEFDYESQFRKPLKGSIFLAKVTRVEPSLQAAFVNFGGNRHGFLPFSEIHPDYFRIPVSDREALMAEQEAELERIRQREEEAVEAENQEQKSDQEQTEENTESDIEEVEHDDLIEEIGGDAEPSDEDSKPKSKKKSKTKKEASKENSEEQEQPLEPEKDDNSAEDELLSDDQDSSDTPSDDEGEDDNRQNRGRRRRGGRGRGGYRRRAAHRSQRVEVLGGTEYDDEESNDRFRFNLRRHYKIQEVIKRGQIMLVQVSREERGNKGAAVSTYLSLPGRYCVLMPNSPHAGGVSRKISNHKDRQKMRKIIRELDTPKGMSVIVRTAGMSRTKTEIKRDLDYLMRLWDNIRELTLQSTAPSLIYEEANLIKRCVRDLYTRDIEEVLVAGEEGYKTAKDFMKMMIPSHAKRVKEYGDESVALFNAYKAEEQITEINQPEARLKSGGYLVINPTEALVSIDVNSGKATKERHIEGTALKTNLEAADEVARQLRLRDLGGLVVIDFIDMEDRRNNAKVERRLKEALAGDRARIQIGRISSFGLLEMSRQRLNPSLTESQFELCTNCSGTGRVRTADATSIMLLRSIEEEGAKKRAAQLIIHVYKNVALYLLNHKRAHLSELEERYGFEILIRVDDDQSADGYRIEVSKPLHDVQEESGDDKNDEEKGDQDNRKSGGRKRGRRGGRRRSNSREDQENQNDGQEEESSTANDNDGAGEDAAEEEKPKRKRRPAKKTKDAEDDTVKEDKKPSKAKRSAKKKDDDGEEKPKSSRGRAKKKAEPEEVKEKQAASKSANTPKSKDYETVNETSGEKKKGWWNKLVE